MDILGYVFLALFFCIYPLSACLLFDRYKGHFHGFKVLNPIVLYSLLSWVTVNGFVYLNYLLDPNILSNRCFYFGKAQVRKSRIP